MLEKKGVGDNYEMLVTVLIRFGQPKFAIKNCHQRQVTNITNITMSPISLSPKKCYIDVADSFKTLMIDS